MGGWRIEPARTGRSTCRVCNKKIKEGEVRFGSDQETATWYHLKCAPKGKPRAFKPFAAKAAAILKGGWKAAGPKAAAEKAPRNKELEKSLAENPADEETQAVYGDWLQSKGDPWGEIIALALAGKEKESDKLLAVHEQDLTGNLGTKKVYLEWNRGFITFVSLDSTKSAETVAQLKDIFALRTIVALRKLGIDAVPDKALIEFLNERTPPSVRQLLIRLGEETGSLALPRLQKIILSEIPSFGAKMTKELAAFGASRRLPALRWLEIYGSNDTDSGGLSAHVLQALLQSPVLKQLEVLCLHFVEDETAALLMSSRKTLAHIKAISADSHDKKWEPAFKKAFGKQLEAYYDIPTEETVD